MVDFGLCYSEKTAQLLLETRRCCCSACGAPFVLLAWPWQGLKLLQAALLGIVLAISLFENWEYVKKVL